MKLNALFLREKNIGIKNPKTLLEAIIKALNKLRVIGIMFFLTFPSRRKKVKKIRLRIDTGLPPWNIPLDVPSNLYDSNPKPKKYPKLRLITKKVKL